MAIWDDTDEEISEDKDQQEISNLTLMAFRDELFNELVR